MNKNKNSLKICYKQGMLYISIIQSLSLTAKVLAEPTEPPVSPFWYSCDLEIMTRSPKQIWKCEAPPRLSARKLSKSSLTRTVSEKSQHWYFSQAHSTLQAYVSGNNTPYSLTLFQDTDFSLLEPFKSVFSVWTAPTLASWDTMGLAGNSTSVAFRIVFSSKMAAWDKLCPNGCNRQTDQQMSGFNT